VALQAQYLPKEKHIPLYGVRGVHTLYLLEIYDHSTDPQAQASPLRMLLRSLLDANYM
jgi:hypothetical protein